MLVQCVFCPYDKTGTEQNVNLVLSAIRAAKRKEKVTAELQLHRDQVFQYTSQPNHTAYAVYVKTGEIPMIML